MLRPASRQGLPNAQHHKRSRTMSPQCYATGRWIPLRTGPDHEGRSRGTCADPPRRFHERHSTMANTANDQSTEHATSRCMVVLYSPRSKEARGALLGLAVVWSNARTGLSTCIGRMEFMPRFLTGEVDCWTQSVCQRYWYDSTTSGPKGADHVGNPHVGLALGFYAGNMTAVYSWPIPAEWFWSGSDQREGVGASAPAPAFVQGLEWLRGQAGDPVSGLFHADRWKGSEKITRGAYPPRKTGARSRHVPALPSPTHGPGPHTGPDIARDALPLQDRGARQTRTGRFIG